MNEQYKLGTEYYADRNYVRAYKIGPEPMVTPNLEKSVGREEMSYEGSCAVGAAPLSRPRGVVPRRILDNLFDPRWVQGIRRTSQVL